MFSESKAIDIDLLRSHWPGLRLEGLMHGGARTEVWSGQLGRRDRRVVVRRSLRPSSSRAWEWGLLRHLVSRGIGVPILIESSDGNFDVDGWHVYEYVDGSRPRDDDPRLLSALARLHDSTIGWPQRPGSACASDLLTQTVGGDVDLNVIPVHLVESIREAWSAALNTGAAPAVVHGDSNAGNALIDREGRCILIDWDEARVDDPMFDLPTTAVQRRAALAWEIATCWSAEPDYAQSLVEQLIGN